MPGIIDLHIANNLEDLKQIAFPKNLGKNSKALERAVQNLYKEIILENSDQEKCYIHCIRYVFSMERLCKIGDAKYYKIFYAQEISKVNSKKDELGQILKDRYQSEHKKRLKEIQINMTTNNSNKKTISKSRSKENNAMQLFANEFISVKDLFLTIQDNINVLLVDIRPADEYAESKVKFENTINIPEDVIVAGLSANKLGQQLNEEIQKVWDKRDSFDALIFIDWNSSTDNITSAKLKYLKEAIVEWDCLRKYKQHPVIVNGGFKDFLDSYPLLVTNVHVNFIRNNEDIDELLELDGISYPEPDQNVSIMPLKQFTIEELEESTRIVEEQEDESETNNESENELIIKEEKAPIIIPKGGEASNEEPTDSEEIKRTIEEQKRKLLLEARRAKNKGLISNDNFVEDNVGDIIKKEPPPIRRDTKPKKVEIRFGGWCGLVNLKNTCYMNTILQCLKCIPIIRSVVHSNYSKLVTRRPPVIINEFAATLRSLCEGSETDKKVIRPVAFYDVVCKLDSLYKKGNHEDCMEFFLFLFNHLNDDCSMDIKMSRVMMEREKSWYGHLQGRSSFWVDLFYHQFKCTKTCQTCRAKADSYETDNTLMLPVPYRPGLRMVHLRDLIKEYLEDNQILDYKCSKCQNLGVVNRKEVVVAPEILVLVLKRYYQDEYQESRKNNVCVDFDLNFSFGNSIYDLYSIAEHRGTMDHGHYYAHGLLDDSVWAELNDERTMRYSGDWDNIRGSACAFFYSKQRKRN